MLIRSHTRKNEVFWGPQSDILIIGISEHLVYRQGQQSDSPRPLQSTFFTSALHKESHRLDNIYCTIGTLAELIGKMQTEIQHIFTI